MTALKGIIAPFTTPFKANGEIDLTLIKPQVDWLIENGVHGLAAGGSTGEGHALSREEYLSLMTETASSLNGRVPLVAGIIANSTSEVIERGKSVKSLNVAALQITPPSYLFRPDDDAMTTYSWQVHDLSGNLIAPNDPLNPRDLYEGIFGMWNYYDPDPNTNPNANPNYPYVGTWYWHRLNGVKDTDDTVDMSNMDNYLYAEQCCALGVGYKINWKNYIPSTALICYRTVSYTHLMLPTKA